MVRVMTADVFGWERVKETRMGRLSVMVNSSDRGEEDDRHNGKSPVRGRKVKRRKQEALF